MATLENMDMKEFGVIFVGALVLTSYIVSLATPWYLVTSAVPFINKDGEEADCFTALQFRWFETSHECNPYECPCVLPYFPGLRTDQQCEIDCEKGNGLFHGIFSLCLISFLCFAGAMFAYVHPHVYSHSIPYALAASSCVFMAAILITQPAAWVSIVEGDAGDYSQFCPAEGGPCNSWTGTHIFNMTTESGVLSIDTMWGPGSGWVIGVISAIGSIAWVVLVALWGGKNKRIDV